VDVGALSRWFETGLTQAVAGHQSMALSSSLLTSVGSGETDSRDDRSLVGRALA
jgi:hypothetical protein